MRAVTRIYRIAYVKIKRMIGNISQVFSSQNIILNQAKLLSKQNLIKLNQEARLFTFSKSFVIFYVI